MRSSTVDKPSSWTGPVLAWLTRTTTDLWVRLFSPPRARSLTHDPRMNISSPVGPSFFLGLLLAFGGFNELTAYEGDPMLGLILIALGLSGVLLGVIAKGVQLGIAASRRDSTPDSSL